MTWKYPFHSVFRLAHARKTVYGFAKQRCIGAMRPPTLAFNANAEVTDPVLGRSVCTTAS